MKPHIYKRGNTWFCFRGGPMGRSCVSAKTFEKICAYCRECFGTRTKGVTP